MTDTEGSSGVPSLVGWEEAHKVASALLEAATDPVCYTTEHAHAVADLSRSVGMEFGFGEGALEALELGALLHDLGKLGVPEAIVQKPSSLTRLEMEIVERHPDIGARMVEPLWCLRRVVKAIRHHHERYDGGGYPDGLQGEDSRGRDTAGGAHSGGGRRLRRDGLRQALRAHSSADGSHQGANGRGGRPVRCPGGGGPGAGSGLRAPGKDGSDPPHPHPQG
jgi:putative nucleotidyltransferase with HDIG domain